MPDNCVSLNENDECSACNTGYSLNSYNCCVKIPSNCEKVDDDGKCTLCKIGYYVNSYGECH